MTAKKTAILVADDNPQLLRHVARQLEQAGYLVPTAPDGQAALSAILDAINADSPAPPDLVILDVNMPALDGYTVCQRVREVSMVPILMLTAHGAEEDKLRGFDAGADDYLTKPFSPPELLARVRAILRRSQLAPMSALPGATQVSIGDLSVDLHQPIVTRAKVPLNLSPVEYRLLAYLATNAGRVITQDLLLEHVWGAEYVGESHLLQVNINRLRRKIEDDPTHPRYLLTKTGIGYVLSPK